MENLHIISALEPVVTALDKLGVQYYIGGSVASSAYGIARATLDIDMVTDLKRDHVHTLVEMLEPEYYIDEEMILEAIQRQATFNIIHLETMIKVDVFISKNTAYHIESFQRRKKDTLSEEQKDIEYYLVSPEDIILNKLDWYRIGGHVSETQWRDVLGVLKVQKNLLDILYLRNWASKLELSDLLEKALNEAGLK